MMFSMSYLEGDNLIYREFDSNNMNNIQTSQCNINDITDLAPGLMLYEELEEHEELIKEKSKFYPVKSSGKVALSSMEFTNLDYDQANNLFQKIHNDWLIRNNLACLEEMNPVIKYLKNLWNDDRQTFFEELWYILKSNLGSFDLKIIYNDVETIEAEGDEEESNQKGKLVHSCVFGKLIPESRSALASEEKIYNHYEDQLGAKFKVLEYQRESGKLVFTGSINKSPIFVMAQVYSWNPLQRSLIISLLDGIQNLEQ